MSDDLEKPCHQELSGIEGPLARKLKEQADRIEKLEAALHQWDNLIVQQFTGSRAAMSSMTEAAQITAALLHGEAPWPETRIEKLETALREIVWQLTTDPHEFCDKTWDIAHKALEGKDD